ncbi:MAG TPA: hypothetical protein VJZ75_06685, partial [Candidatus Bathyarchaeia archaeon]|nr:hypothetical protein [Candidatus Bathyarchaeia archaeon]
MLTNPHIIKSTRHTPRTHRQNIINRTPQHRRNLQQPPTHKHNRQKKKTQPTNQKKRNNKPTQPTTPNPKIRNTKTHQNTNKLTNKTNKTPNNQTQ